MLVRMLSLILPTTLLASECISLPDTREGTLDVLGMDITAQAVGAVTFDVFPYESGTALIKAAAGKVRLRYGRYRIRAWARGFSSGWGEVQIAQPENLLRIILPLGAIGCADEPATIGGIVNGLSGLPNLWVKVVPVRGTGSAEARVSRNGYFLLSGLERTDYLLLLLRGEDVLYRDIVRTYPISRDTSRLIITPISTTAR